MSNSPRVFIAIGSNLEPRFGHLQDAVRALQEIAQVKGVSSVYESLPVGYSEQPDFLNAVIEISTESGPFELLHELKQVEARLGRKERPRWHEREIDFDIIFYGDLVLHSNELHIPHPELANRAFVLEPLADIDANFVDPVSKRSVTELLSSLPNGTIGLQRSSLTLAL